MVNIILVGAGDRGMIYANESLRRPDLFRVTAVVEPVRERRDRAGDRFRIPLDHRFASMEELLAANIPADAAFNCTMDQLHCATSIPLLRAGYHLLLEKPIAPDRIGTDRIRQCAKETGRIVMVCHILRYSSFYTEIRKTILSGVIGKIIHIQMAEQVSYYHESVSYVRGKYGDPEICGSGMLLSKCSHDLDIMAWLMEGNLPVRVYSDGSAFQYQRKNMPAGAAERCLPECPYEADCVYSAKRLYVEHPQRWANRVWNDSGLPNSASDSEKIRSLNSPENPYGRCVYGTQPKIVDHQSVLVTFADGALGTFTMTAGAAIPSRTIHITGTKGELSGRFEENAFTISLIDPDQKEGFQSCRIDTSSEISGDAHGGGDQKILDDFFTMLAGHEPSICCTGIEQSVIGHEIVYRAEESRQRFS